MNSLFHRILSLLKNTENNPLEDYLTEIFAEVIQSPSLLTSFVKDVVQINVSNLNILEISSQKTYAKLDNHDTESRPDLVIRFSDGGENYVIFLESKLGSQEGYLQLKRYADHLKTYQDMGYRTHLMYVTKFHDPKDETTFISQGNNAEFHYRRWYQIYKWLADHKNEYIDKVLAFMEEIHLNETRRFVPQDIYAIQHMQRLINMMDSCIDGAAEEKMNELFGKARVQTSHRFNQLRNAYRYMLYNDLENYMAIAIGFYLTDDEYPLVCIMLEVNPKCEKKADVVKAMKELQKRYPEWESEDIDDPAAWSNISCYKELLHFLGEEDHISSIQSYFMKKLDQLAEIKEIDPKLGWRV